MSTTHTDEGLMIENLPSELQETVRSVVFQLGAGRSGWKFEAYGPVAEGKFLNAAGLQECCG